MTDERYPKRRNSGRPEPPETKGPHPLAQSKAKRIVIFTGSGISVASGMSTFSQPGGLYERARKRFGLQEGMRLFYYSFYLRNRRKAQGFFADLFTEAIKAVPTQTHHAIKALSEDGRLQRHYTLNIDGLASQVGLSLWREKEHGDSGGPGGSTAEMHGNIRQVVCGECGHTQPMTSATALVMKRGGTLRCQQAECPSQETGGEVLRSRIMLYDDAQTEKITDETVLDTMEEDVAEADLIIWTGISFEQSASVEYFRKVRRFLQDAGKAETTQQAIVNPSDDAFFNLETAVANFDEVNVCKVLAKSDDFLPLLVESWGGVRAGGGGGGGAGASGGPGASGSGEGRGGRAGGGAAGAPGGDAKPAGAAAAGGARGAGPATGAGRPAKVEAPPPPAGGGGGGSPKKGDEDEAAASGGVEARGKAGAGGGMAKAKTYAQVVEGGTGKAEVKAKDGDGEEGGGSERGGGSGSGSGGESESESESESDDEPTPVASRGDARKAPTKRGRRLTLEEWLEARARSKDGSHACRGGCGFFGREESWGFCSQCLKKEEQEGPPAKAAKNC